MFLKTNIPEGKIGEDRPLIPGLTEKQEEMMKKIAERRAGGEPVGAEVTATGGNIEVSEKKETNIDALSQEDKEKLVRLLTKGLCDLVSEDKKKELIEKVIGGFKTVKGDQDKYFDETIKDFIKNNYGILDSKINIIKENNQALQESELLFKDTADKPERLLEMDKMLRKAIIEHGDLFVDISVLKNTPKPDAKDEDLLTIEDKKRIDFVSRRFHEVIDNNFKEKANLVLTNNYLDEDKQNKFNRHVLALRSIKRGKLDSSLSTESDDKPENNELSEQKENSKPWYKFW